MVGIDGKIFDMPDNLKQVLSKECDVESSMSSNGLCNLVICERKSDSSISKAIVLELDESGTILKEKKLMIMPRAEDAPSITKDTIMKNFKGELL